MVFVPLNWMYLLSADDTLKFARTTNDHKIHLQIIQENFCFVQDPAAVTFLEQANEGGMVKCR